MANSVKRKLSIINLSLKNNLPTFQVNVSVIIRVYRVSFTNSSRWSNTVVFSQWIGWWYSHVYSTTADFSIIPPLRHVVVPSVSSPVPVWSPWCRLGRSCSCMPDVLSHPSHIGYHHQWSLFLLLSLVWAAHVGCFLCRWGRIVADKFHQVISYLEYWMFINFTLRALSYKMVHITFKW